MSPVYEGMLDATALAALLTDLDTQAEVLDVFVKAGPRSATSAVHTPLRSAFAALESGETSAIQVRYRFAGEEWRDTLLRTPAGVRLVRAPTPS